MQAGLCCLFRLQPAVAGSLDFDGVASGRDGVCTLLKTCPNFEAWGGLWSGFPDCLHQQKLCTN